MVEKNSILMNLKIIDRIRIRYEREYPLKSMGDKIEGNIVDFIVDQNIDRFKGQEILIKEDYIKC